jgi:hypothetical protein
MKWLLSENNKMTERIPPVRPAYCLDHLTSREKGAPPGAHGSSAVKEVDFHVHLRFWDAFEADRTYGKAVSPNAVVSFSASRSPRPGAPTFMRWTNGTTVRHSRGTR